VKTIEGEARTSASPAEVWGLIADVSAWPRWGTWTEAEVEGGGEQGLDAVRVLVKRPYRLRERIVEWVPGERLSYELLEGMKVQGYRSTVTLEEAPEGGTIVRWRSTYDSAGPITALVLRTAVRDAPKRLARAAAG
jgi:hypothetical protein